MEKYRLIRLNEVKYTDDDYVRDALIEQGFVLEPLETIEQPNNEEPNNEEPTEEPTEESKNTKKSGKK